MRWIQVEAIIPYAYVNGIIVRKMSNFILRMSLPLKEVKYVWFIRWLFYMILLQNMACLHWAVWYNKAAQLSAFGTSVCVFGRGRCQSLTWIFYSLHDIKSKALEFKQYFICFFFFFKYYFILPCSPAFRHFQHIIWLAGLTMATTLSSQANYTLPVHLLREPYFLFFSFSAGL